MNCTRAEELIPLHAGGDLLPSEADALRQHIESCAQCRQSVEEFAASQDWLREFSAPDFDDALFAEMRASVLREIERTESAGEGIGQQRWFGWLWPEWSPRFVFAATVALLILISGLAALSARRGTSPQEVVITPSPSPAINQPSPTPQRRNGTGSASDLPAAPQIAIESRHFPHRHHNPNQPVETPRQFVPDVQAPTTITAQATPGGAPTTEPGQTTNVASAQPDTLRIEFQTADPNIRIIWFAPKAGKNEPNTK